MSIPRIYGFEMAIIAEVYLSTLSALMEPNELDRHFTAFVHLCENSGKLTQNDLAKRLKRDRVSAMRIVDDLCDKGLIIRKKHVSDRRCYILEVTERAIELLPKVKLAIEQTNEILLDHLSKDEREFFSKSLDQILKKVETLPDPEFLVKVYKRAKENKD
ncbi:MAG: MarR family transcriptional regulator [Crocinitomicaceae bacterium]